MTTILKEKIQDEGLLSEMIELLEGENIKFSISNSAFHTIVFAEFPELGNGSLRFAITAPKNRYSLDCYYDNDEDIKPYIFHLVKTSGLLKQSVMNRIKHVTENLDEIVHERRISKANNHI
ncbi:hypothetical protein COD18_15395 [Bacillus cereus]|nr:hypothetical protein COD18_15395 [Bacillus cereus]